MEFAISASLLIILISVNCCSGSNGTNPLIHDIWALESIGGEKVSTDSTVKNLPVLEIYLKEERVYGNTGCNILDGEIKIDGSSIKFLNLVTTEMACPNDLEKRFLTALQKVDNYKIEKLRLHLYEDKTEVLILKKID